MIRCFRRHVYLRDQSIEVMRDILQSRYLRSNVAHKQLARTSFISLFRLFFTSILDFDFRSRCEEDFRSAVRLSKRQSLTIHSPRLSDSTKANTFLLLGHRTYFFKVIAHSIFPSFFHWPFWNEYLTRKTKREQLQNTRPLLYS